MVRSPYKGVFHFFRDQEVRYEGNGAGSGTNDFGGTISKERAIQILGQEVQLKSVSKVIAQATFFINIFINNYNA